MNRYNVAVLGATGAVGTELLNVLEQRKFPVGRIKMLALEVGSKLPFQGTDYVVEEATPEAFRDVQIALFAGGAVSKDLAPEAVLFSYYWNFEPIFTKIITSVADGTASSSDYYYEGGDCASISDFNEALVPKDVQEKVLQAKEDLAKGSIRRSVSSFWMKWW